MMKTAPGLETMRRTATPIPTLATAFLLACGGFPVPGGAVPLHPRLAKSGLHQLDVTHAVQAGLDRPAAVEGRLPAHVLVLLVEFPDQAHAGNHDTVSMQAAFFGAGGSLRDFYLRSSFGRLDVSGSTSRWVRVTQPLDFYAAQQFGIRGDWPHNARRLVEDAVRAADPFVDFSRFDNDGPDGIPSSGDDDGFVDALVVVHAGAANEETGDPGDLLSHSWFTPRPVQTADGTRAWNYAFVAEGSPLGVRVHEFGHQLGLPDLYAAQGDRGASGGLGDWSLMASGAWLGDGEQPADLDAPSKIQLGFVDPIVPAANATALPLTAAASGAPPQVYQVWTHGLPAREFLVLENRRAEGQDVLLPGGGLLVYHVNLGRAGNDDPLDPRVQLLQADGASDLEFYRNNGDGGDPWPGAGTVCCRIDSDTTPSTRARDGSDSQVRITNISAPTGVMHFDLVLETRPLLEVVSHTVRELDGDGDGVPEAGEELEVDLQVENLGLASDPLDLTFRAEPEAAATWSVQSAVLTGLAKGTQASVSVRLRPAADLGDPAALVVHGEGVEPNGRRHELGRVLALGKSAGFRACLQADASRFTRDCSDPAGAWGVEVERGSGTWTLEYHPGDLGHVYRSARGPRYANGVDVALVSPPFNLAPGSTLQLLHSYAIEDLAAGWSMDGGRVEISLHGGSWEAIAPRRGYPRRLFAAGVPDLGGAEVFAGRSERRWDMFDLGGRAGSARLRFRFVSNDSIGDAGWEIARVEVGSSSGAAPPPGVHILAEPNPVQFPARVSFQLVASRTESARSTRLLLFDARGRFVRALDHAAVPAQSGGFLWDGMDHAGRPVPAGIYLARLEWGSETATGKILVLR
jgi:immune inhibitor A